MHRKVLKPFWKEKALLECVVDPLVVAFGSENVLVATSDSKNDDDIESLCVDRNIQVYRGSEQDVLGRFILAAKGKKKKGIVRICSDNPFVNVGMVSMLLESRKLYSDSEYISFELDSKPIIKSHLGLAVEFVSLSALEKVKKLTSSDLYHEHVTNFVYEHAEIFSITWLPVPHKLRNRTDIRLTVDTANDFQMCRSIYENVIGLESSKPYSLEELIAYIDSNPQLLVEMNNEINKNEK
jgi:spore coat polysaccharide biosynthesis protein SpsF